jgi:hypothetical protein
VNDTWLASTDTSIKGKIPERMKDMILKHRDETQNMAASAEMIDQTKVERL